MAGWTDHKRGRGVSLRAILLAVILIPFNALWIQSMELIWGSGRPTSASLLFNAVFVLLVLALGNLALGRWAPRWAFEPGELVVVYVMLCLATALAGHDSLQVLVLMVAAFGYYASPANRWEELLGDRLPSSLIVTEPRAVRDFWEGGAYLYSWESLHPWLVPAALWIGFTVVLLGVMMCINILVWRRWNDQERLTYPLIEIPFQLTSPGAQLLGKDLFGNKLLWLGLAVAASIDLLNGFAYLYPAVPSLHVTVTDLTPLVKAYPWRAMGQVAVGIYPFASPGLSDAPGLPVLLLVLLLVLEGRDDWWLSHRSSAADCLSLRDRADFRCLCGYRAFCALDRPQLLRWAGEGPAARADPARPTSPGTFVSGCLWRSCRGSGDPGPLCHQSHGHYRGRGCALRGWVSTDLLLHNQDEGRVRPARAWLLDRATGSNGGHCRAAGYGETQSGSSVPVLLAS